MNDQSYLSITGAELEATAAQADLVNSTMHLFKQGYAPTPTSPLADFQANECDYDGYAAKTIAAWGDPVLAGVAWAIYAPTQTFRFVSGVGTANNVAGYWIQTAGGDLKDYCVFGSAIPMSGDGQAVIKTPIEVFPAG